jgi:GTP pyrophosphokinase
MANRVNELLDLNLDALRRELDGVIARLEEEAQARMYRALALAKEAHSGQVRDNGTPYLAHPMRVALSLARELDVWDADLLCGALLHDVLEDDENLTPADIMIGFGARVAHIVEVLTKPSAPELTREERASIYFSRLLAANDECKLVKLVDKLDNVRDAANSPDLKKQIRTAAEAKDFYLDLASTLSNVRRRETILGLLQDAIQVLEQCIIQERHP